MALLYHAKFRGMLHLARHDQRKMLAYLEIPRFLNPHLTSDSSVDSSRDPVSYKAESGENGQNTWQKEKKYFQGTRVIMSPPPIPTCPFLEIICNSSLKNSTWPPTNTFFIPHRVPWDGRSGATWIHRSQWPPLTGQQVNKWPQEFPMGGPRRLFLR